jgi:glycosyltransferase involved in cell wall biosynthesis
MKRIILDCDLMRFRHSGLYYYCLYLGNYVQKFLENQGDMNMGYYIPTTERNSFDKTENNILEKKYHRFFKPFLWNCRVWHAPFQSGRILPSRHKHPNVKILLTIHDLNSLHEGRSVEEQKKSLAHTQELIDRSDAIVCISEFTRSDVLKNCEIGGKPVYVIYNGTSNLVSSSLHTWSYRPARPFLFGMGYVNQKKNYHVLLSLLKANEDIELLIAGRLDEPDYIHNMKQTACQFGVEDRLRLLGPVSENEKSWYLSNCHAFVHPSKAEGFGLPVLEAMSFGKPVFISRLTSLPEIGGNAAFYFSSFEETHIQHTFHQGMHRYRTENMSSVLKKRSQDFSWEKSARDYIRVYQSLF